MTDIATAAGADPGAGNPANAGGGAQPQPATQATQPWYQSANYTDEDRAYIENKGWHKGDAVPRPVFDSYRNLEKVMRGKEHAMLPPKMDDESSRKEFFSKLGLPESPDKYPLPAELQEAVKNGTALNDAALGQFRELAHKADLLPHQFQQVLAGYEQMVAKAEDAKITAFNGQVAQTVEKLKVEMGQRYGEEVARGNLAMQQLGIAPDDLADISEAIGVERATRLLMKIGGMMAEHKAVGLNNGGKPTETFVTDKAKAQANISRIQRGDDPNFKKAMLDPGHPDNKNTVAQWREWNRIANS